MSHAYTIFKVESAIYGRTPSGRWSTVPSRERETSARTWQQQQRATGDDEARFFHARRTFRHIAAGVYCARWVAPVAWGKDERLIETAAPVAIPGSACGERERYILMTASDVIYNAENGRELYTILGVEQEDGHTPSCVWDATNGRFVG